MSVQLICRAVAGTLLFGLVSTTVAAQTAHGFISAASRVDVAFDTRTDVLYISGTDEVRRYDMQTGSFLSPIQLGGRTLGMDISPDGKTLAVANGTTASGYNHVDLVNLETGESTSVKFDLDFYEGGTYSVAYDSQGKLLVSSKFNGSGWTPLRRYDPTSDVTVQLGQVRQNSMLSASADRNTIAITESNISSGSWGYYHPGDTSYGSQRGTGWFTYEIAVSPDGSQFAVPTYKGTFVGSATQNTTVIGTYAGVLPIGAAYSPVTGNLFLPFAGTNYIAEYNSQTLTEIARYTTPSSFSWTGNGAYGNGRLKVAADGSYLFSTIGNGVYFTAIPVPEPSVWAYFCLGLIATIGAVRRRSV